SLNVAFRSQVNTVLSLAFSPDSATLAGVCSGSQPVKVWDVRTGQERLSIKGLKPYEVHCVAFSPDGKLLAGAGDDETIKWWDVRSERVVAALRGHVDAVTCLAFSPDGKTLASASEDRTVKVWPVPENP